MSSVYLRPRPKGEEFSAVFGNRFFRRDVADRFGHFLPSRHNKTVRENTFVRRTPRVPRIPKVMNGTAAVLIGAFQITYPPESLNLFFFQEPRMAHAGIKPYIENIDLLGKFSILAVRAGCVCLGIRSFGSFSNQTSALPFSTSSPDDPDFLSQHFILH